MLITGGMLCSSIVNVPVMSMLLCLDVGAVFDGALLSISLHVQAVPI